MAELTKRNQALLKRAEKMLEKQVSFEEWLELVKIRPDLQELIKQTEGTPEAFYNKGINEILDLIERIKNTAK